MKSDLDNLLQFMANVDSQRLASATREKQTAQSLTPDRATSFPTRPKGAKVRFTPPESSSE